MRNKYAVIAGVALACLVVLVVLVLRDGARDADTIRIGSKNFTEQVILGEIVAALIESGAGMKVDRNLNLGGTFVCFNALKGDEIDLYVEYTGTGLTAILKSEPIRDAGRVHGIVSDEFSKRWGLQWMRPLGFNNTYTLTMRRGMADSLGIASISDLAEKTGELTAGFNHEFLERPDGYRGLKKHYELAFDREPREMDSGLMYKAVADGAVDVICGFATDGRIRAFDLVSLEDDRNFFPPYQAAVLVRHRVAESHPELMAKLERLTDAIDSDAMTMMNYRVDQKGERPAAVAREFLESEDIL
ncbi:MAG: glycine/betaine ABC transporter substrate-binding protein [Chitinivibrionales bacterium]|nr:glycine/betaine ABC transporter substrate-binding protein [Chitinivibrionales bacterium]MBD3397189.1 glycine/betaine ABC transporter substrate-binding protein [Chitinivibrionales bacterium]